MATMNNAAMIQTTTTTTRNHFAIHSQPDLTSTPTNCNSINFNYISSAGGDFGATSVSSVTTDEHIYENLRELGGELGGYDDQSSDCSSGAYFSISGNNRQRLNNHYFSENIYENICEDCGRLYDSKCNFCFDGSDIDLLQGGSRRKKPFSDYIPKIFRGIKVKRKLSRKDSQAKKKLDIVHQIEDDTTLFRTNETFCMQEICQMRQNSSVSSTLNGATTADNVTSKDSLTKVFNDTKEEGSLGQLVTVTPKSTHSSEINSSVKFWLLQIMNHTDNYDETDQYFVKHIPSATFNNLFYFTSYDRASGTGSRDRDNSGQLNDDDDDSVNDDTLYERVQQFIASRQLINEPKGVNTTQPITFDEPVTIAWKHFTDDPDFAEEMEYKSFSVADGLATSLLNLLDTKLLNDCPALNSFNEDSMTSPPDLSGATDNVVAIYHDERAHDLVQQTSRKRNLRQRRKKCKQQVPFLSSNNNKHELVININTSDCLENALFKRIYQCLLSISLNTIILLYDTKDASVFLQCNSSRVLSQDGSVIVQRRKKRNRKLIPRPIAVHISKESLVLPIENSVEQRTILDCSVVLRHKKGRTIPLSNRQRRDIVSLPVIRPIPIRETNNTTTTDQNQENIYQSLWKCKSACHEDDNYASLSIPDDTKIHDHEYWELADDFVPAFDLTDLVDENKKFNSRVSAMEGPIFNPPTTLETHELEPRIYSSIQILYSLEDPSLNHVIFPLQTPVVCVHSDTVIGATAALTHINRSNAIKRPPLLQRRQLPLPLVETVDSVRLSKYLDVDPPDCVKAWMSDLKEPNWCEDEEDVIMTPKKSSDEASNLSEAPLPSTSQSSQSEEMDEGARLKLDISQNFDKFHDRGKPIFRKNERNKFQERYKRRRSSIHVESPNDEEIDGIDPYTLKKSSSLSDLQYALAKESSTPTPPIVNDEQSFKSKMNKLFNFFRREKDEFKVEHIENKVFGSILQNLDKDDKHSLVPIFVTTCIRLIEREDAISTQGLYRASGNKTVIDEVKKKINNGSGKNNRFRNLKDQEVNNLAGLLKLFFRELEEPILSKEASENCLDSLNADNILPQLRGLINGLPPTEKATLLYLLKHLKRVSQRKADNKMDSLNLSIVWGPCIFKAVHSVDAIQNGNIVKINRLMKELIDNCDKLEEIT